MSEVRDLSPRIAEARSALAERYPAGLERRLVPARDLETRDSAGDGLFEFRGFAAVFDSPSEDLGGFTEIIRRGAFKKVLGDDVRLLVNHNPDLLLARTTSGTLELSEKPEGLFAVADVADTQTGRDLRVLIDRGDLSQMSFAFTVLEDEWDTDEDDNLIRYINKARALFDVSPVTYPAYPDTSIEAPRSLAPFEVPSLSPPESEHESEAHARELAPEAEPGAVAGDETSAPLLSAAQRSVRLRERRALMATP
jgi:HK97 family phage prohead protease